MELVDHHLELSCDDSHLRLVGCSPKYSALGTFYEEHMEVNNTSLVDNYRTRNPACMGT